MSIPEQVVRLCPEPSVRDCDGPLVSTGGLDESVLQDLPPQLLAEIQSTMPLCERVKMNKRKRSTVNDKPKYAEVDSEDDNEATDCVTECEYLDGRSCDLLGCLSCDGGV